MEDIKIKECLENLFNSITTQERSEAQELVKNTIENLKSYNFDFSNPEYFNGFLMYKLKKGVKEVANAMHEAPLNKIKDKSKPNFIYLNYDFLEHNLSELCVLREGGSCCADKSRSILKMYLKYSLTGTIPEFNPGLEHYWIPKFGTYEEWIELCEGLYNLYYGKTERYFKAYNALIQSEIRRYKHILHTWFIKFKDGEVIKFNNTWDDKQENPLDNEYYDKGEYYIVHGKYVKNRNYEVFEDKELIRNYYYKVPKIDIEEVYKISEEKMV